MTNQKRTARVRVPASSANLGAGFDCIGIAVDRWLSASVETEDDLGSGRAAITVSREGTLASLDVSPESDALYTGFAAACALSGHAVPKKLIFSATSEIPVARGLGSSSAALVAGAQLADAALSLGLGNSSIAGLCSRIEGHPDNVAPAVFGGAILGVPVDTARQAWRFVPLTVDAGIAFVFVVPPYPVDTAMARALLPSQVTHAVAVEAAAKSAALVEGLRTGDRILLKLALDDVLHVPYRRHLVPGLETLRETARDAGAYGATLSGSGPTIVAITSREAAQRVADAIRDRWTGDGVAADAFVEHAPAPTRASKTLN